MYSLFYSYTISKLESKLEWLCNVFVICQCDLNQSSVSLLFMKNCFHTDVQRL